jgi:hypothetical protein
VDVAIDVIIIIPYLIILHIYYYSYFLFPDHHLVSKQ